MVERTTAPDAVTIFHGSPPTPSDGGGRGGNVLGPASCCVRTNLDLDLDLDVVAPSHPAPCVTYAPWPEHGGGHGEWGGPAAYPSAIA